MLKIRVVQTVVGMINIDGFGSDIQISEPDRGPAGIEMLFEIIGESCRTTPV